MRGVRSKYKQAQGVVSQCSSRVAKSGSYAHSFHIGKNVYSVFSEDDLSPVTEGDVVSFEYEERWLKSGSRRKYCAIIPETLSIGAPAELNGQMKGVVYILSNPSMPGLLKVGFTTGTAAGRASELSHVTGVPTGFKVEWFLPVSGDPRAVEQRAHAHLAKFREGKEFFKVTLAEAKAACVDSFTKLYPEKALSMEAAFAVRAEKEIARRNRLSDIAAENERKKAEEERQKAYEQSDEGQWRKNGVCRVVVNEFAQEPNVATPSFLSKLFGSKFEDYLDFKIKALQAKDSVQWSVSVSGRKDEKNISEHQYFSTSGETLDFVSQSVALRGVFNYRAIIDVPNTLIDNPPQPDVLPKHYLLGPSVLVVKDVNDLSIRTEPIKPRWNMR